MGFSGIGRRIRKAIGLVERFSPKAGLADVDAGAADFVETMDLSVWAVRGSTGPVETS